MRLGTAMNSGKKGVRKMREKSQVDDIDRSIYDIRDEEKDAYRMEEGLTPEIVDKLSKEKDDPVWMQQFRLQSLQIYNEMPVPNWEPSIDGLDIDHIATYVRPNTRMQGSWKDVPQDIKDTFERLGIPQAERKSLAGVGAQYDSELVYHNVKSEVEAEGVVYTDMESALKGEYADMVRKYFMKLVTPQVCSTAWSSVVRRFLCLCAEGSAGIDSAAVLFPSECQRRRTV